MSEKYRIGPDVDLDEEVVLGPDGQRITEERAQEIAEEAVARVRRGRPSLSGEQAHSPRVQFRVPSELVEEVEAIAAGRGVSVSQVAREALARYVESSRSQPDTTTKSSMPKTRGTATKGAKYRGTVTGQVTKQAAKMRRAALDMERQARKLEKQARKTIDRARQRKGH